MNASNKSHPTFPAPNFIEIISAAVDLLHGNGDTISHTSATDLRDMEGGLGGGRYGRIQINEQDLFGIQTLSCVFINVNKRI